MILRKILALVLCLAIWPLEYSNAQTFDPTTGLLISTTGNLVTGTWSGAPSSTIPLGGCCTSNGSHPTFNTNTNTLQFGFGQGTASQTYAINTALANAGTGIEVAGYNYSWQYYNTASNRGTLSGQILLTSNTNATLATYNYSMPQNSSGWVTQSGTQNFATQYLPTQLGNLKLSFTGKDDRFWAGYYGPLVRSINIQLNYGVNPCTNNPAYAPSCPGYSDITTSSNLVPNNNGYTLFGSTLDNSFAINTAFQQAGIGLKIYGFNYGFDFGNCFLLVCVGSGTVNAGVTDKNGAGLYSHQYTVNNSGSYNYQYLFPSTQTLGNLGSFNYTATSDYFGVVSNMRVSALYTPDACMINPQSSKSCPGYVTPSTPSIKLPTTTTTTVVTTTKIAVNTGTVAAGATATDPTQNSVSSVSVGGATVSSSGTISPQDNVPQTVKDSVASAPAPAANTSSKTADSTAKPGPSALAMSVVKQARDRVQATEKTAIQQSQVALANSVAQSQQSTALAVSIASQSSATATAINNSTAGSILSMPGPQTSTAGSKSSASSGFFGLNPFAASGTGLGTTPTIQTQTASTNSYQTTNRMSEITVQDTTTAISAGTKPGNPLNDALSTKLEITATTQEQKTETVNRNAPQNEAAGSVTIEAMATQPKGFDAYSVTLKDAAFYAPREVYANQTTVDNVRALRQMASERLYQQMLDQQYKIGE